MYNPTFIFSSSVNPSMSSNAFGSWSLLSIISVSLLNNTLKHIVLTYQRDKQTLKKNEVFQSIEWLVTEDTLPKTNNHTTTTYALGIFFFFFLKLCLRMYPNTLAGSLVLVADHSRLARTTMKFWSWPKNSTVIVACYLIWTHKIN